MDLAKPRTRQNFTHQIRVDWGDCDPARIAYTERIPGFALTAIDAWWEHFLDGDGWFQLNVDRNIGTPFVHMNLEFRSPITPRHRLDCTVWPARLGSSSIEFRVDGYQDGTLCFEGRFVCVFVTADEMVKIPAPAYIRAVVEAQIPLSSAE